MIALHKRMAIPAVLLGLVILNPAQASSCKSLDEGSCGAQSACRWVDAYQRSDGRTVKAYCRSAPRKSSSLDPAKDVSVKADS